MRVLIVKMSAMGDIIHALPVLDYLHNVSPGIEIDWLVEEPFLDVVDGNPQIAMIHTARSRAWRKSPFSSRTFSETAALKRACGRETMISFSISRGTSRAVFTDG
ncbi:hypothetical protein [Geotalea toluenoxydans]|uniref:hypothetical protein n=1 Tax=Geotalea toluenoxydans TaxID=421624 RepID=UPI000AAEAF5F